MTNSKDLLDARTAALSKIKKLNQPDDYRVGDTVQYIFSTGHPARDGNHVITKVTDEWIFASPVSDPDRSVMFHRDGTGAPELRRGVNYANTDTFIDYDADDGSDIGSYLKIISKSTPERVAADNIRKAFRVFTKLAFDALKEHDLQVDVYGLQDSDLTIKREITTYENF